MMGMPVISIHTVLYRTAYCNVMIVLLLIKKEMKKLIRDRFKTSVLTLSLDSLDLEDE